MIEINHHEAELLIGLLNRTRMSDEVIELLRKIEIAIGMWK